MQPWVLGRTFTKSQGLLNGKKHQLTIRKTFPERTHVEVGMVDFQHLPPGLSPPSLSDLADKHMRIG